MSENYFKIFELIDKMDYAEIPRFVQDRLKELERNAEKTQVLPIKKTYSQFISPSARCFQNPRQRGIFFDTVQDILTKVTIPYLKKYQSLSYFCENELREDHTIYTLNCVALDVMEDLLKPGFFVWGEDGVVKLSKYGLANPYEAGIYFDNHAYNYKKYDEFTKNRETYASEIRQQKCASDFEISIAIHNILKFLDFDSELTFTEQGVCVLVHSAGLNHYLIYPKHLANFVEIKDKNSPHTIDAPGIFSYSVAIDHFDNQKQFNDWYYGNAVFNFACRDTLPIAASEGTEEIEFNETQEYKPKFVVNGLNKSKENDDIYQM